MKEERLAILRMLENGVISVDEAEKLLNAVRDTENKWDFSENFNGFLSKTGDTLEEIAKKIGKKADAVAKTVGEKAEAAKPEIKRAAKIVKEKVDETASNIREDIKKRKNADDIFESDFREKKDEAETVKSETDEKNDKVDNTKSAVDESIIKTAEDIKADEDKKENISEFKGEIKDFKDLRNFIPQAENSDELKAYDYEEDRDYEAEFNKMMAETNGDIFGEVLNPIEDTLFAAQQEWQKMQENAQSENETDSDEELKK